MSDPTTVLAIVSAALVVILIGCVILLLIARRRVGPNQALVVSSMTRAAVFFHDRLVAPLVLRAWLVDLAIPEVRCSFRGSEGLCCRDGIRVDVEASFRLSVNRNEEDVLNVARSLGWREVANSDVVDSLFAPKFSEALQMVAGATNFIALADDPNALGDRVGEVIGSDLSGITLEEVRIDLFEQTPRDQHVADRIPDAPGILKITEQWVQQRAFTRAAELAQAMAAAERAQERALRGES